MAKKEVSFFALRRTGEKKSMKNNKWRKKKHHFCRSMWSERIMNRSEEDKKIILEKKAKKTVSFLQFKYDLIHY